MKRKLCSLVLALAMVLNLAACGQAASSSSAASSEPAASKEPAKTPAYSTEGFVTVDADGNRVTTGRDATSTKAMATASKYEVSQVGAEIMAKGGNAVDAAVAMGFALGVCEPFTSGLGGGGLATIHTAEGENFFIDFREVAPAAATLDLYVDASGENNGNTKEGGLASGVPGEVAGLLYLLEHHGTMSRGEVMEPAIRIANEGFTVSAYCANAISDAYEKTQKFPEMSKVYLDENGLPWEEGSVITNPDLGKALQLIADQGADVFYKGEIGEAMVATLAKYDGVMTMDDLAGYEVHELKPVTGDYRGYTVISSPPPSSGGTHLIEILNILENFDMASMEVNSAEYVHLFAETFKLAFADRAKYMADTNFVTVPLGGLTSQAYADKRAQDIDLNVAMEQAAPDDPSPYEHTDTTHFSVADVDGNCVAVNKIEPGMKPLSSMSPTVVLKPDGSPFLVLGTPGGSRIFSGVAEVISRVIDSKMDLHTAISVPKIWNCSNKNNLQYEKPLKGYEQYALTDETIAKLTEMGHGELKTTASGAFQCIMFMDDGTLYGTADPRQDGKAVGVN